MCYSEPGQTGTATLGASKAARQQMALTAFQAPLSQRSPHPIQPTPRPPTSSPSLPPSLRLQSVPLLLRIPLGLARISHTLCTCSSVLGDVKSCSGASGHKALSHTDHTPPFKPAELASSVAFPFTLPFLPPKQRACQWHRQPTQPGGRTGGGGGGGVGIGGGGGGRERGGRSEHGQAYRI